MSTKLKKITQEEFDTKLNLHFKYLKGGWSEFRAVIKDCSFDGIILKNADLSWAILDWSDFSEADMHMYYRLPHGVSSLDAPTLATTSWAYTVNNWFENVNFSFASLRRCKFGKRDIHKAILEGAILIDAEFDSKCLTKDQRESIILTEEELTRLADTATRQSKKIEIQAWALSKIEMIDSSDMLEIFNELRESFALEERRWLLISFLLFAILFLIADSIILIVNPPLAISISYIVFAFAFLVVAAIKIGAREKRREIPWYKPDISMAQLYQLPLSGVVTWIICYTFYFYGPLIATQWTNIICGWGNWLATCIPFEWVLKFFIPIVILFTSWTWFILHQYGRAKKLRIEQQNKQGIIHFMRALMAYDGEGNTIEPSFPQFAPFFANAIVHRPFSQENYDPQLPLDEIAKVISLWKEFVKSK